MLGSFRVPAWVSNLTTDTLLRLLWAVLTIAVTVGLASFAFYFVVFNDGLSGDQAVWGQFGDFVGGTLNPIFGFLTLIALMLTIVIQNKELHNSTEEMRKSAEAAQRTSEHFEREAKRADLYRLIEKLTERINRNYNENRLDNNASLHAVIAERYSDQPRFTSSDCYRYYQDSGSRTHRTITWIEGDMRRLMGYIQKYESVSGLAEGETPLPDYYRAEYHETVEFLKAYSMIAEDIFKFFSLQPEKQA
jgi:uncharacterized membrane protein